MGDLFDRLSQRLLATEPVAEPLIAPRFDFKPIHDIDAADDLAREPPEALPAGPVATATRDRSQSPGATQDDKKRADAPLVRPMPVPAQIRPRQRPAQGPYEHELDRRPVRTESEESGPRRKEQAAQEPARDKPDSTVRPRETAPISPTRLLERLVERQSSAEIAPAHRATTPDIPAFQARESSRKARDDPRAKEETVIRVHIGRIEVRATPPPPAERPRKGKPAAPTLSLDTYLEQRTRGRR